MINLYICRHDIKIGNVVTLRFHAVAVKELSSRTTIGTIPEGFRPPNELYVIPNATPNNSTYIMVQSNGDIKMEPTAARTYFANLSYVAWN